MDNGRISEEVVVEPGGLTAELGTGPCDPAQQPDADGVEEAQGDPQAGIILDSRVGGDGAGECCRQQPGGECAQQQGGGALAAGQDEPSRHTGKYCVAEHISKEGHAAQGDEAADAPTGQSRQAGAEYGVDGCLCGISLSNEAREKFSCEVQGAREKFCQ